MSDELRMDDPRRREPLINAPWTVVALVASLFGTHALRLAAGVGPDQFAVTRSDLETWRLQSLFTYMFVHANWVHVGMNSAFTLAFGAPVARSLGLGWRGATLFFAFFLTCGVASALSYAGLLAVWPGQPEAQGWALIGASGAASGLMGAAARLIEGRGRVGPISGRVVVGMTLAWIIINAVLGLSGLTPGAQGAPVAWQAHIFGFMAGLLLIVPANHLA